nr:transforming growth factor-beta-induced protein ig-h3-like [Procambarus clarkii]
MLTPPHLPTPLLLLLLLLPLSWTEQQRDRRYHISPSGTYHLASNPRIIYKPGRDVCVVEEVPTLNLTFPLAWTPGTYCTHPTYLRQRCCEGYTVAAREQGCPVEEEVEDTLTTGEQLGGCDRFLHLLHRYRLHALLHAHPSAHTLLLPLNQGFRDLDSATWSELGRAVRMGERWSGPPLLLYHLLPRRWYTAHLYHGQHLPTLYQDHPVTVTLTGNKMVLVNCVPVVRVDLHARDGVVQVISRPLPPAYTMTLADLISGDPKLTIFYSVLGYAEMVSLVRHSGPLTVFAPTNDAFRLLPRRFLDSITYDAKYFPALQALGRQHLVEGTECSTGLRGKVRLKTVEGSSLPVGCSASLTLTIGNATVTTPDVITSNGVLHYVDRVLIPPMALSLVQVARRAGATRYIHLVRKVGLFKDLVSFGPYTVFAPSNQALRGLKRSLVRNLDALRNLVLYHLAEGAHASFTLKDNHLLSSRLQGASLRIKIHPKVMSVEDGVVTSSDHVAFNGYVHVLDKVLTPPTHTLARTLALTPTLSRFTALFTQAGVWAWRDLSLGVGPYTLLAVKDEDMETWATDTFTYYRIIHDLSLLNQSLNTHLLEDFVMPRALQEGSTSLLRPRQASRTLRLTVTDGRLSLRHASVSDTFLLCTNGIILFIDALLLP